MTKLHAVGITASRDGLTDAQLDVLSRLLLVFRQLDAYEFHHGDCVGGDAQCATIAREFGYRIVGHPPLNPKARAYFPSDHDWREREYHDRNRDIHSEVDVLIGCPAEMREQIGGTWWTIKYARKIAESFVPRARKPLIVITPDGRVE
jgi:hypothetical protein